MYKMICLDMDGTLLNKDKTVSDYTRQVLINCKLRGIEIVLATGRCNKSAEYIVKNRINVDEMIVRYLISTDGTMIKDLKSGEILYQADVSKDIVISCLEYAQTFSNAFYLITENQMYYNNKPNLEQNVVNHWYQTREFFEIDDNLQPINDYHGEKVNRILFFSEDISKLKYLNELVSKRKDIQTLYRRDYHDYQLLLISKSYSKAMGLTQLSKRLGILPSEVIAFGDSDNDIEMLKWCGYSVAMKNASEDLKEISDDISLYSNHEDGVGHYLSKLFEREILEYEK